MINQSWKRNVFGACSSCQIQHCLPPLILMNLNQCPSKTKRGVMYISSKKVATNESFKLADGQIQSSFNTKIII